MASSEQLAPAQNHPAADIVGNAFVEQYYHMLHESPELVHKFYQDVSKLGRPENNGIMGITTTMQDINEKILSLDEFIAEIISVDSQESYGGGVLVLVTGFMIGKDCQRQKFSQCFFLAPQEKGYFVLNDVFRYVNDSENQHFIDDAAAPAPPPDSDPSLQKIHVSEQIVLPAEDVNGEEVYNPDNGQAPIEEEEAPVPEVVDEIPDDSLVVAGSTSIIEEVPKKSYASIVMKERAAPALLATTTSVRSAPKSLEQHVAAAPPAPSVSEINGSNTTVAEPVNNQETEAEGYSIFVKNLPTSATPSVLESEFKKFGPIKLDGIQVRSQRGFCFGFVEFEVASAVQSALEASPIVVGGRKAFVEEKRSTNRGNGRPRFLPGRGAGYRNEGGRGRGNQGNGRNYGRGDFSRPDSGYRNGNRGGYSNRGNNGFQRVDHVGNTGGRVNRNGGLAINSMAKATSVPATA